MHRKAVMIYKPRLDDMQILRFDDIHCIAVMICKAKGLMICKLPLDDIQT